jgi:hypothetical protein
MSALSESEDEAEQREHEQRGEERSEGDAERAIQALGASQHLFAEIGAALDPDLAKTWGEIAEFASTELGTERAEELRRQGAEVPLDDFTALLR